MLLKSHRNWHKLTAFPALLVISFVASLARAQDAAPSSASPEARIMQVRITDEAGNPLEGASLHVSIWELPGEPDFPNTDYFANAEGIAEVRLPQRMNILRMWPAKPGYVPQFRNFARGTHDQGRLIPDKYEFQLAQGTRLGGTVVDEKGQPVEGVKVQVSVEVDEPNWQRDPKSMISTWLTDTDFGEQVPVTDSRGRWFIHNAPPTKTTGDYQFRLKFSHPDYISDNQWGELQQEQKLTTKMLRDESATLVMKRGRSVRGTVVDYQGEPVSLGTVIWRLEPFGDSSKFSTKINYEGEFETQPLPAGPHPIVVISPGLQPQRQLIQVDENLEPLRIQLQEGERIAIQVVNNQGQPLPDAKLRAKSWSGVDPTYQEVHTGVLESRVPRRTDEKGRYTWSWAPAEPVTYQVWAPGHLVKGFTLVPKESDHVVTLFPRLIASGKVTDAESGQPIERFRVIRVKEFRPEFLTTIFNDTEYYENGTYEIELADEAEDDRWRLRIEADGYRTAISKNSYAPEDGSVTVDFQLQRAATLEGRVLDPQGQPADEAVVVPATPTILADIFNNKVGSWERSFQTDSDGRFQTGATWEPTRYRVIHDSGFAEILRQPDEPIGTIELQRWASLSGQLMQEGKPVAGQSVRFSFAVDGQLGEPRFQHSYATKSDEAGYFVFQRLPPVAGFVKASLGPWRDSPLTSSLSMPLELKPGEHREVPLGGEGITITGRVIATGRGEAELDKNWSLNYLISRDRGIRRPPGFPELSFDPSQPVQSSWFLDHNRHDWLATRENYFVKLQSDGQFVISGVPPGTYDLVLRLYEAPAGCLVETVGAEVFAVEVTGDDVAQGTKDIGNLEVPCRVGPRVGENMQLYEFTDTEGRRSSIYERKGQFVLMHVWASWCAPCLEHMADIQATLDKHTGAPVTVVGLNVDKDPAKAKAAVERGSWHWAHEYLGDNSEMARQLAISTVPTYYLIGPDGLLAASSTEWSEIEQVLTELLAGL